MKFVIFVIDKPDNLGSEDEMRAIDEFNERLQGLGYWILAAGIESKNSTFLIDNRNGSNELKNETLFKSIENYSGFWIIDVPNIETAKQLALEGSKACNRKVELRPFLR
jgi:hypothetical protein